MNTKTIFTPVQGSVFTEESKSGELSTFTVQVEETPEINAELTYWVEQVKKTRNYGHTYVHVGMREDRNPYAAFEHGGITFSFVSFGRSLGSGGHKYKVRAHRGGKPVSTKELGALLKA